MSCRSVVMVIHLPSTTRATVDICVLGLWPVTYSADRGYLSLLITDPWCVHCLVVPPLFTLRCTRLDSTVVTVWGQGTASALLCPKRWTFWVGGKWSASATAAAPTSCWPRKVAACLILFFTFGLNWIRSCRMPEWSLSIIQMESCLPGDIMVTANWEMEQQTKEWLQCLSLLTCSIGRSQGWHVGLTIRWLWLTLEKWVSLLLSVGLFQGRPWICPNQCTNGKIAAVAK